jgi:hypothetical protein
MKTDEYFRRLESGRSARRKLPLDGTRTRWSGARMWTGRGGRMWTWRRGGGRGAMGPVGCANRASSSHAPTSDGYGNPTVGGPLDGIRSRWSGGRIGRAMGAVGCANRASSSHAPTSDGYGNPTVGGPFDGIRTRWSGGWIGRAEGAVGCTTRASSSHAPTSDGYGNPKVGNSRSRFSWFLFDSGGWPILGQGGNRSFSEIGGRNGRGR